MLIYENWGRVPRFSFLSKEKVSERELLDDWHPVKPEHNLSKNRFFNSFKVRYIFIAAHLLYTCLLGAKDTVAGIAQTGNDVALIVQLFI